MSQHEQRTTAVGAQGMMEPPLTQGEVDMEPWKYIGYRGFAAFAASDDDFLVLRRFDRLHTRVLLERQDDLAVLEERLEALDGKRSRREAVSADNGTFRHDVPERRQLVATIEARLRSYDEFLLQYTRLKSRATAPRANVRNMDQWLRNRRNPIHEDETRFLRAADLITVARSEKAPLRRAFERYVLATTGLFSTGRGGGGPPLGVDDLGTTVRGDDGDVDTLATVAIFFAAVSMLIAPLWVLARLATITQKLAVITAFSIVFLAVVNWGTLARPFETLAAVAGYCAVLVVFLQLGTGVA